VKGIEPQELQWRVLLDYIYTDTFDTAYQLQSPQQLIDFLYLALLFDMKSLTSRPFQT